ncbi:hypothetical protein NFX39_05055 [Fructobacillus sp. W13]|uniref:DUF4325 domain-containing protein n=1 Tax=Fructobacillus apis TaxID=2935017 RepID=A0ABT0ZR40_9LACO|nr:hypothetical protein [Fructobacillus apis]MCO0832447.1 hypothetical protein [Fructobacillus apis]
MEKVINLDFGSSDVFGLAGVKEGSEAFKKQVDSQLTDEDWNGRITIRFPDSIVIIGTSFWAGFVQPIVRKIGSDGIINRVTFITSSEKLTEGLYRDLY